MPQLTIELLGQVQFLLAGCPLTDFESDKARALLIYLAMQAGQPHRREHLCALLWPDQPEKRALQNLRQTLHRLRHTLRQAEEPESPFLLITPQSVQFNAESDYALDVNAFEALIAETRRHRHRQRRLPSCRACMQRLTRAVEMYGGGFLAGFSIKNAAAFDEWAALQRERLRLQVLDALDVLATHHERRGEDAQVEAYARRQIELEPWQESAHRQLMRTLARRGKRALALAQYTSCAQALERELGIEPEAETTALYEQIRAGERESVGAAERLAPAHLRTSAPLINFPARLTSFVGREAEVAQIGEALQDPNCRLLTLVGMGGSGKTRLTVEVAKTEVSAFEHGACFVALAPLTAAGQIATAIANTLSLSLLPAQDAQSQVFAFLREREMLLVLDNFEHLMPDTSFVSELLQACPHVNALVTSREPMHLYGEREFPVLPLVQAPAVELFVQRSQAVKPDFQLSDEDTASVAEICERVDGLPLAIELAAARSKTFAPLEMAAQLRHRLAFLTGGARDLPARHQTLWNTLDWSHELLTPPEQILFRRLAAFTGGFTPASVESVCNADGAFGHETRVHLVALREKSLIYTTRPGNDVSDSRYNMLETIREYAHVKWVESGEGDTVRRQHLDFFLRLAEEAETKLPSAERPLWFERLDAERDNLTSALEWAFEREPEMALRLAVALGTMWEVRTRIFTGRAILERALAHGADAPKVWRAKALYWAGRLALRQGNLRQARVELRASFDLYRDLGDRSGMGFALNDLGSVAHWCGDYGEAQHDLEESLTLRLELGNAWWIAQTLNNLGMTAYRRGDAEAAQRYFEECLRYFQQTEAEMPLAWPLGGLGQAAFARGDYAEAKRLLEESVAIWRKHRFDWALSMRLNDFGLLLWTMSKLVEAQHAHQESLDIARDIGDQRGLSFALEGLARVAFAQGDVGGAKHLLAEAEAQRQQSGAARGAIEQATHDAIAAALRV